MGINRLDNETHVYTEKSARWHVPKKLVSCFFDELDAIGGARFDDGVSGDNKVQRTMLEIVNQLDRFDARGNIKVLMATNRPDTLNPSVTSGSVVGAI
ncbi:26S proteasome regulatory subunit 7 [Camellia lanceoleosa]|uniref:26S proteasome regulatory subunit 7 n=1 Tax=Camellia lanceoleosa TaxID=1840588 RepID=A0ACC0IHB6_9ERIC|nr:26S proteasome regulatory subunit 7 [Camellia lanceoleosa]